MNRRMRLGQHFLRSASVAEEIVSEARITSDDTVFELGTGLGILTPLLCARAGRVISIDADKSLVDAATASMSGIKNLVLEAGDGLKSTDRFTVFVSNLPYSKSRDIMEWLALRSFSHGVVMVQKEFADKLMAGVAGRRAVSIIANHAFEMRRVSDVGRNNFDPPPRVDSVVIHLRQKNTMTRDQIRTINKIFSYRRKTVRNILRQFGRDSDADGRLDDMTGDEIVHLADEILR
ncbi:MAG: ribose ABC transporter permease [Nitrosopumilus sp. H8]|nr:MAG: ribose ABC transporter permease [Nitrosopumilus sp. H8]